MVFSVIFDSSFIIKNVLDIQSFFLLLAFHINDIHYDFRAVCFDAAHDDHNTLNFCIYVFSAVFLGNLPILCVFVLTYFHADINKHNKMY